MILQVTATDVAKAAGVSQPTVSRVFTPGANVADKTRELVERTARELGYRPNKLARAMNRGKSNIIGLVVAYLDNPFYAEALETFSSTLQDYGYHVMIFIVSNAEDTVEPIVEDLLAHQVDGIVLASISTTFSLAKNIKSAGIPVVLFNRAQADLSIPAVTAANRDGGRRAAEYLIELGHRRIAHISGWQKSQTGLDRMAGFLDGLKAHDREPFAVIDSRYERPLARAAVLELFDGPEHPDAIFVGNDHMAFAVIEALRHDLGLNIPDDVSVMGYDDIKMAAWRDYDLTTLRQPANRMVQATVEMLITQIRGETPSQSRIEIESELMVRGSTRAHSSPPSQPL